MSRVHLRGVRLAWAVCAAQAIISLMAALAVVFFAEPGAAMAALYGGFVAIVPTAYFALRIYLRRPGNEPSDVVGSFYRGEMGKFALTALMFFFGVARFGDHFLPLLCTYVACLAAYPAVLLVARID